MAIRAILLFCLLGGLCADDKADIAYLKSLLQSMQDARKTALASGDAAEASRLLIEIEEVEYVIAHIGTELVQPDAPPPPPSARTVETRGWFLEGRFEGPARDLLARLEAEAGVQIVEQLPERELGQVRVSAGAYEGLALARAVLLLAGVDYELVEPGPILVIRAPSE